jgi:pimeloyl-ACP methyl ester carboxylesterase
LKTDFRCVACDQRGWGESDRPETGYSVQDLANDAEALIRTLGLTRYVLIGHSIGGKVAQLLAAKRPGGLEALILVAPAPPSPMNVTKAQRKQMIQAYENREAVEFLIQNVLTAVPLPGQIREQIIEDTLKGAVPAKYAWHRTDARRYRMRFLASARISREKFSSLTARARITAPIIAEYM